MSTCIYWKKEADHITYKNEEDFDNKLLEIIEDGGIEIVDSRTRCSDWLANILSYHLDVKKKSKTNYSKRLFVVDMRDGVLRMYKYSFSTNVNAGKIFRDKFKDLNNGATFLTAFGTTSSDDFRFCCPKPVYYIDKDFSFMNVSAHQIDVTSMYPANSKGRMPDSHTAIKVDHRVAPTEEYPFAFYTKSNHCAEYGVFDTHDYLKLPRELQKWMTIGHKNGKPFMWYNDVPDEEEVTILMKPSTYTLDSAVDYFFALMQACDKKAKFVSNAAIGTFHPNPDRSWVKSKVSVAQNSYYHLAAIILGRANKVQLDMYNTIEQEGGVVLQMVVDCLIYTGADPMGIDEKELGKYYNEFKNVTYRSNGKINQYVLQNEKGELVKVVVAGYENPVIDKIEDIDVIKVIEEETI